MSDCPRCVKSMHEKKMQSVEVEECSACMGLLFDTEGLRKAKDETDPDLKWLDFEIWNHEELFRVSPNPLKCPRCAKDMVAMNYGETDIQVDYCVPCRRVWLDGGEFEKIIHALTDELTSKHFSDYVKTSLKEAKEIFTGPENFLSEWKDLVTVLRMLRTRLFVEKPKLMETVIKTQSYVPIR